MSFESLFALSLVAGFVGAMSEMGGGVVAALMLTPKARALAAMLSFALLNATGSTWSSQTGPCAILPGQAYHF